jgi:hypothetical protein
MAADTEKNKEKLHPQDRTVTLGAELRKAHDVWFGPLVQDVRAAALEQRKAEERAKGKKVPRAKVAEDADTLDRVRRRIQLWVEKAEGIAPTIIAFWAHTDTSDIQTERGLTQVVPALTIGVDPQVLRGMLSAEEYARFTAPILVPELLLAHAAQDPLLRTKIQKALTVLQTQVSVFSPSSRAKRSKEKKGGTAKDAKQKAR